MCGCGVCDLVGSQPEGPEGVDPLNWPNAITLSGYAAALAWLAGGSPAWVLWSLAADELDGEVARATGEASSLGAELDWGVDICLAAVMSIRLGAWWAAPLLLFGQTMLHDDGIRPHVGSARALGMIAALAA